MERNRTYMKKRLSEIDDLTGCNNRRYVHRILRSFSDNEPISVALLDINGFKNFNSQYYSFGDSILRGAAEMVNNYFAQFTDIYTARYGGDEFVVISKTTKKRLDFILKQFTVYAENCFTMATHLKFDYVCGGEYLLKEWYFESIIDRLYSEIIQIKKGKAK